MLDSNPQGAFLNIDPELQPTLNHSSGWAFALEALAPLHDPAAFSSTASSSGPSAGWSG